MRKHRVSSRGHEEAVRGATRARNRRLERGPGMGRRLASLALASAVGVAGLLGAAPAHGQDRTGRGQR